MANLLALPGQLASELLEAAMNFVYGWLVGAVMGGSAVWIYKNHLIHEAEKLKQAAQKAVPRI